MPEPDRTLPKLYAILDVDHLAARGLDPVAVTDAWLAAGVRLLQLRAKSLSLGPALDLADALTPRARRAGATFIVNDRADVARLCGADGVHLGQDDLRVDLARRILGPAALVGLSTHSARQARAGCTPAVSYLAIGPVFPTTSKAAPDAVVGLAGVREAARIAAEAGLPLVAIGGITSDAAPAVLAAGATAVAVISGLLAGDPAEGVRRYLDVLG